MTVNFFVVQENLKGEKKNKLLFSEDRDLLFASMEIKYKRQLFQIQYMQLEATHTNVICYEINKKDDTKNTKNPTPGNTKDDEFPECRKC